MRPVITGLGLAIGVIALTGCAVPPPPPPPMAIAEPVPLAAAPPVPFVPAPPPIRHHAAAHPVVHHHVAHRYSTRIYYAPAWSRYCGSVAHPCTVEHTTAPIQ